MGAPPHRGCREQLRIRVITHPRLRLRNGSARIAPQRTGTAPEGRVVAIGASTGGPRAVLAILKELPEDFALPILLVIHIAEPFGAAFADWLDGEVALPCATRARASLWEPWAAGRC